jgi:hypothetical protein
VPYTDGLRRQFQRAVAAWVADLFRRRPAVRRGRAYWSISPALSRHGRTAGGVRVGFDDDAAYLAGPERLALSRLLVVPPHLSRLPDLEAFRYATLLALLAAGDLALVSVWNPTFLSALFDRLGEWQDRLAADLAAGAVRCDRRRADHVRAVLRGPGPVCAKTAELWPGLALISCWADAAAARFVDEVRLLFPQVEVQPKGLLATEGCVSFPLAGRPAPVLALRSHFFEFEETAAPGRTPRLAHQLEEGGRYRVILTTAGGLYRYQLRDEVEAAGFLGRCPLLRFVGKADRVSDLVGEKLSEAHVRTVLDRALAGRSTRFVLLAPTQTRPPCYVLFLEGHGLDTEALADEVQAGLEENPHYRYAVALGQLGRLRVVILPADGPSAWGVYERVCLERGQKLGDIKPAVLDAWTGWADRFETAEPRS